MSISSWYSRRYNMGIDFSQDSYTKTPMNLSSIARQLLSKDDRALVKAGFLTSNLELTTLGQIEILSIMFKEYKTELVKVADEQLKETSEK